MNSKEAIARLTECGVKPSVQRIAIMHYLLTHYTHPTVDDVYRGLCGKMPTLSRTTVYNTLRLLSENNAAQMITIDEHRVCYDGNVNRMLISIASNVGRCTIYSMRFRPCFRARRWAGIRLTTYSFITRAYVANV